MRRGSRAAAAIESAAARCHAWNQGWAAIDEKSNGPID
jgi:hypothetical protein